MVNKKLKVAWICHFSNEDVRARLPLSKRRKYSDFAPWITNMIQEFEKIDDVELHVIAPHMGLKRLAAEFQLNGIYYYFYKPDLPLIQKRWPSYFPVDVWSGFFRNRLLVKRFINKIEPEIINLHGAENDYYSVTALDYKKIPVYVCIQGIYSNPRRFNEHVRPVRSRIRIERLIHKKFKYFGIFPPFFADLIKRDNADPIFLQQSYFPNIDVLVKTTTSKKVDFVFFGRVSDVKGIDNIIRAISYIKQNGRETTLNIIGPYNLEYYNHLQNIIREMHLNDQITFVGHLPTLADVHKKVQEAKVAVISSKFENLPGTIVESALLGIPVTATRVGGIPYLNKEEETILLSEYGDIESLADNMLRLLDNPEYAQELTRKCRSFIIKEFNGAHIAQRYVKQYKAIISHFWGQKPIDKELLFDYNLFKKTK